MSGKSMFNLEPHLENIFAAEATYHIEKNIDTCTQVTVYNIKHNIFGSENNV